jgi:mRNA interferase RelE/StbE
MRYLVEIGKKAERELKSLRGSISLRVGERLMRLGANPRPPGCKKLRGTPFYRIRIGDYRAIYTVVDKEQKVIILSIGHRGEVYRRL